MAGTTERDARQPIGLTRLEWVWLLGNLLWLFTVATNVTLAGVTLFRAPEATGLERAAAAVGLIAVVPLVVVVGFAIGSYALLAGAATRFGRIEGRR